MFVYTAAHWITFFSAAILLTLAPGPDLAFILAQTAKGGRKAGFLAMYGIWVGALSHVILAAVGLSAVIATSAMAFSFVKYLGAAYLVWLGIRTFMQTGVEPTAEIVCDRPKSSVFRQGMLVAALNPKTAIFFLSFLPQFVVLGAGSTSAQLLLHGFLVIAVAVFIEPPLILAGAKLRQKLSSNQAISQGLEKAVGAVFIGLGLRLAFMQGM
jgi:threonine/homoserine/homoserine lactone efflux protein